MKFETLETVNNDALRQLDRIYDKLLTGDEKTLGTSDFDSKKATGEASFE